MIKDKWDFVDVYLQSDYDGEVVYLQWSGYPIWLNTSRVHNPELKRGTIEFAVGSTGQMICDCRDKEFVRMAMEHFLSEVKYDGK